MTTLLEVLSTGFTQHYFNPIIRCCCKSFFVAHLLTIENRAAPYQLKSAVSVRSSHKLLTILIRTTAHPCRVVDREAGRAADTGDK